MKQFLLVLAVLTAAAIANGCSIKYGEFSLEKSNNTCPDITEEQKKCIDEEYGKVKNENANLQPWFDDIEKTVEKLKQFVEICLNLTGDDQVECFEDLRPIADAEMQRLFGNMNEQQKTVMHEMEKVAEKCLKEDEELAYGCSIQYGKFNLEKSNGGCQNITEEQKKCIEDGIKKVQNQKPELKPWFDDIDATTKKLNAFAEFCQKLNGKEQRKCYKQFEQVATVEMERLFANLTEQQGKVLEEIMVITHKCLQGETVAFDVLANGLLDKNDVRMDDEQKQCIQDGYLKVKAEYPNLKSWFDDIEQTSNKLGADAEQCYTLTGYQKVKCFIKLYGNAREEFNRLFSNLSEEQQQALDQLKLVVVECLQIE